MVILWPIFTKKQNFLTHFFAEQCSILQKSSKLQTNLAPRTDQSLTSINFSQDDILKTVQNLNPDRAHGPDKISILIKICGKSLSKPLEMVFKYYIRKISVWMEESQYCSCSISLEGGKFPLLFFQKLEKSTLICRRNALIVN